MDSDGILWSARYRLGGAAAVGLVALLTAGGLGATELVSVDATETAGANDDSEWGGVMAGPVGRRVTFASYATDLTGLTDSNGERDVFSRDLDSGVTVMASVNAAGTAAGDCEGYDPHASPDGRYVVFTSCSTDLVAADTNEADDVFLRDVVAGTTTLVSVTPGGDSGNDSSSRGRVSADGRYVVFESWATNLTATAHGGDAFLNVYLRDVTGGTTTLVSVDSTGTNRGDGASWEGHVSDDGRYVLFQSTATDFEALDSDGQTDVFLRDVVGATTTLVSANVGGTDSANHSSTVVALTPDGKFALFTSLATDLVATADTNGLRDLFHRDLAGGVTSLVSIDASGTDAAAGAASESATMTPDGRWVAFRHPAADLVATDTNGANDIFLRDVRFGRTTLVSRNDVGTDSGGASSSAPAITEHGRWIAFESNADDLVATDGNGMLDVFVWDRLTDEMTLVSLRSTEDDSANGDSAGPLVSADGRVVTFGSVATDLVALPTGGASNLYQQSNDLRGGTVWLDAFEAGDLSGWTTAVGGP